MACCALNVESPPSALSCELMLVKDEFSEFWCETTVFIVRSEFATRAPEYTMPVPA